MIYSDTSQYIRNSMISKNVALGKKKKKIGGMVWYGIGNTPFWRIADYQLLFRNYMWHTDFKCNADMGQYPII